MLCHRNLPVLVIFIGRGTADKEKPQEILQDAFTASNGLFKICKLPMALEKHVYREANNSMSTIKE